MRIYLLRHGQAEAPATGGESELTAAGRKSIDHQAERFAALLKQDGSVIKNIFHSGKKRAAQTAAIVASRLAATVTVAPHSGLQPNDDPRTLLIELQTLDQPTLYVSHLPFIPTLINQLTGAPNSALDSIPAGTLITLQQDDGDWHIVTILTP